LITASLAWNISRQSLNCSGGRFICITTKNNEIGLLQTLARYSRIEFLSKGRVFRLKIASIGLPNLVKIS